MKKNSVPERYRENQPGQDVKNADPVWLSPKHKEELLVFVHIPKAAGTTFNDVLWQVYGKRFLNYHRRLSGFGTHQFTQKMADELFALSGHFPFGFHKKFGFEENPKAKRNSGVLGKVSAYFGGEKPSLSPTHEDGLFGGRTIKYVSVVRDPADRLYSYYRFVTSFPAHRLHAQTKGMNCVDFFAYMDEIENRECRNLQAFLVSGCRNDFDACIEAIEKHYTMIAPLPQLNTMIDWLTLELDWPQDRVSAVHKNISPKDEKQSKDREFVADYTREHCAIDYQLFDFVTKRFDASGVK